MRTVVCYSVRVRSLREISDRAVLVETFDGRKDVLPKSQIYGRDIESRRSDAYWISEWILEQKNIQFSHKKMRLVDRSDSGNLCFAPTFAGIVINHTPDYVEPVESNEIDSLRKPNPNHKNENEERNE